jgi:hypothetical protein
VGAATGSEETSTTGTSEATVDDPVAAGGEAEGMTAAGDSVRGSGVAIAYPIGVRRAIHAAAVAPPIATSSAMSRIWPSPRKLRDGELSTSSSTRTVVCWVRRPREMGAGISRGPLRGTGAATPAASGRSAIGGDANGQDGADAWPTSMGNGEDDGACGISNGDRQEGGASASLRSKESDAEGGATDRGGTNGGGWGPTDRGAADGGGDAGGPTDRGGANGGGDAGGPAGRAAEGGGDAGRAAARGAADGGGCGPTNRGAADGGGCGPAADGRGDAGRATGGAAAGAGLGGAVAAAG